ncbi:sensor histidine kinase [Halalkalibacter sp. APA_J-10(15)]|uniref:sensor histidine kinase n=1 Tax=unclassified Halalkalibacter TaxID=2893063 RepID=UPI001FF3CAF6|nr:sensor histidine kinase [Halalkalibacter sp. APA_J-10(15)]MCK0470266.1 sensor histidine kinase [Halalkalibacter sp. APA_J-10(15)]
MFGNNVYEEGLINLATDKSLDSILDKTLETVDESREKIFEISEQSRHEYTALKEELKDVRLKVGSVIDQADQMSLHARLARNRLMEVSKNFSKHSSDEIRSAYEQANEYQIKLAVLEQEEKQLRDRRDRIERRLIDLESTVERAEQLTSQMSVVYNFLSNDLKNINDVLEDAKEKQQFGLKIIEAQEAERKKLSREIHDGPAQMMANVLLRSDLIDRIYREQGIDQALNEIKDLRMMVKSSLAEVRRIIYDLRPMALDDLGLIPTLKKYLKTFQDHHLINTDFYQMGHIIRLPQKMEIAAFRLVQEAVQNAYKHAEPTNIEVKIEYKPTKVIIVIKDDGKGFDPSEKKVGSFGLMGMKERVNMLSGQLTIHSKPKYGTAIVIGIPLSNV